MSTNPYKPNGASAPQSHKGTMQTEVIGLPGPAPMSHVPAVRTLMDNALSVETMQKQIVLMQEHMANNMKEGDHYGKVPGCGEKPALFKAGAEKLCFIFQLAPRFDCVVQELGNGHREVRVKCSLYNRASGDFISEGEGSCSTLETKYRYRNGERTCPKCGKAAIIKGREEYGGGWVCFHKKDGCGAKFRDGAPEIEQQITGKIEFADPADYYNTVLKMAQKRAHVAATLTGTAASDIFTQDLEDFPTELRGGGYSSATPSPTSEEFPPMKPARPQTHRAVRDEDFAQPPAPEDVPTFEPDVNPWKHVFQGQEVNGKFPTATGRALFEIPEANLHTMLKPAHANKVTKLDKRMIEAALKAPKLKQVAAKEFHEELDNADFAETNNDAPVI